MRKTLRRFLPSRESLRRSRMLKPIAGWLEQHGNWRLDAQSVARGVALGLFFGFLIPVAQIVFAVIAALFLRANPPVAALATLVTNPFTFPFVYLLAHRIGKQVLEPVAGPLPDSSPQDAEQAAVAVESVSGFFDWIVGVGAPLATGLLILAVSSAVLGYLLVLVIWRWQALARLRRCRARPSRSPRSPPSPAASLARRRR